MNISCIVLDVAAFRVVAVLLSICVTDDEQQTGKHGVFEAMLYNV